jgi:hypothetical protein
VIRMLKILLAPRLTAAAFMLLSAVAHAADLYVGPEGATYYSIANEGSTPQGFIPAGEPLSILSARGQWIYVSNDSEEYVGWVLKANTSTTKPKPRVAQSSKRAAAGSTQTSTAQKTSASSSSDGDGGIGLGFILTLAGLGMLSAKSMGSRLFGVFLMFVGFSSCVG